MGIQGDYPLGIRFWRQDRAEGEIPSFYVVECMGRLKATDIYYFQARGHNYQFIMHIDELNKDGFKPFLLNVAKIRKEWDI